MPISFRIDPRASLVHTRFEGEITVDQLRDYNNRLRRDPNFHPGLNELVELLEIEPRLDSAQMTAYRNWFVGQAPLKYSAIVATNPLAFGMARAFAALAETGDTRIQVHRCHDSAMAWLACMNKSGPTE